MKTPSPNPRFATRWLRPSKWVVGADETTAPRAVSGEGDQVSTPNPVTADKAGP